MLKADGAAPAKVWGMKQQGGYKELRELPYVCSQVDAEEWYLKRPERQERAGSFIHSMHIYLAPTHEELPN